MKLNKKKGDSRTLFILDPASRIVSKPREPLSGGSFVFGQMSFVLLETPD
jgi:hypothetical protein